MVTIIPVQVLKKIYQGQTDIEVNRTYIDKSPIVRWLYWNRLKLIAKAGLKVGGKRILDVGCGQGVFLPTLSKSFETVDGLDLDVRLAQSVKDLFGLDNVTLYTDNIFKNKFAENTYDIIFAASVLEHFKDGEEVILALKRLLKPGGHLVFSSPTETWFYELMRKVFGYTKPADHYLTTHEIANAARPHLTYVRRTFGPILVPRPFCPYCIYTFRKEG